MKAIFWDGDGFVIWYKRLERGTWQLPAADSETLELEAHELAMILRGIDLKSARLHVHNHHRKKYGCTCGKCGITIPPLPEKPIEKCIAGPGLISSLIVSKTGDHLPIYRSEDILVRQGLHDQSTT
jgi:transposase